MATIEITPDELVVHVTGVQRVLALRSELRVPLAHVLGAEPSPPEVRQRWRDLLRVHVPGTDLPFVLMEGSFLFRGGELGFWDVHDPDRTVLVRLDHERYQSLVLQVEDPAAAAASIQAAVAAAGKGPS